MEKNERLVEYRKCATILLTPLAAAQRMWTKHSKTNWSPNWSFLHRVVEKPKNEFLMVIWIISDSTTFLCSKMYVLMAGCCTVSSRKSKGCDAESALQLCQVLVPGKYVFVGSQ